MKKPINITILRGPQFYKFSDCFLDTVERRLFKKNKRLEVTPRAFEVLQLLIEHAGELISKDDLLDRVWGGNIVEEGNLTVQISKLRSALGANRDEPYIVTGAGGGYTFVSKVHVVDDDEWAQLIENELAQRVDGKQKFSSIAIMPLLNESGEEDVEYLADGITESLINSLSNAEDLRVIARNTVFQFKDSEIELKKLGRKLRVETILTGRIRLIRNNLVIGVELTKVADGTNIWGTRFNEDFDDIFEVQDKISNAIASISRSKLLDVESIKETTQGNINSVESYKHYLVGNYFLSKSRLKEIGLAVNCYRRSIACDPTNADSYSKLAYAEFLEYRLDSTSHFEAQKKMKANLKIAGELAPDNVEFRLYSGVFKICFELDIKEATRLFSNIVVDHPNHVKAHGYFAIAMAIAGNASATLKAIKTISDLDPFSIDSTFRMGRIFYLIASFEQALRCMKEVIGVEEDHYGAHLLAGTALVEMNQYEEALVYIEAAIKIQNTNEAVGMKGYIFARMGERDRALFELKTIMESERNLEAPYYSAHVYSALRMAKEALDCLELAFASKTPDLIALKVDPRFENIRKEPRYRALLMNLGLLD